jgi:hypothetical protein
VKNSLPIETHDSHIAAQTGSRWRVFSAVTLVLDPTKAALRPNVMGLVGLTICDAVHNFFV